jgi:hypothetical protein
MRIGKSDMESSFVFGPDGGRLAESIANGEGGLQRC